jgi:hypothetical protein
MKQHGRRSAPSLAAVGRYRKEECAAGATKTETENTLEDHTVPGSATGTLERRKGVEMATSTRKFTLEVRVEDDLIEDELEGTSSSPALFLQQRIKDALTNGEFINMRKGIDDFSVIPIPDLWPSGKLEGGDWLTQAMNDLKVYDLQRLNIGVRERDDILAKATKCLALHLMSNPIPRPVATVQEPGPYMVDGKAVELEAGDTIEAKSTSSSEKMKIVWRCKGCREIWGYEKGIASSQCPSCHRETRTGDDVTHLSPRQLLGAIESRLQKVYEILDWLGEFGFWDVEQYRLLRQMIQQLRSSVNELASTQ